MQITVFCASSQPRNPLFTDAASELGRRIALAGHTLLYGGSNLGLMGVVSSAAMNAGGRVVAVIPTFFSEDIICSQRVTELVRVNTLAERKERLIADADACVALPGGVGTLDETMEVLAANQLRLMAKPMILLNIDGFYDPFLTQMAHMRENGFLDKAERNNSNRSDGMLRVATSVTEAMEYLDNVFIRK